MCKHIWAFKWKRTLTPVLIELSTGLSDRRANHMQIRRDPIHSSQVTFSRVARYRAYFAFLVSMAPSDPLRFSELGVRGGIPLGSLQISHYP